jgi:mono/diheme cytochrome c family protein
MRRTISLFALLLAVLVLLVSGCGGGEEVGATPETVIGEVPTETTASDDLPALALTGNASSGEGIFTTQGCGGCHTLAAAGSGGTVGPNLDDSKPSYDFAVTRVTKGQGAMPAFGDQLEAQQIADVAQYIVESTGG